VVRAGTSEPVAGARVTVIRVNVATGANSPAAGGVTSSVMTSAGNPLAPPPPPTISSLGGSNLPVTPASSPALPVVAADRQGRFSIPDLDDGTYRLLVIGTGYVRQEFGQRIFPGQGTPLTLSSGQAIRDLKMVLTPAANLSGRIVDESGQPAIGMSLTLMKAAYNQYGLRTFQSAGTATTNDRGEYRIYFVTPGRYYLSGGTTPGPTIVSTTSRIGPSPNDPLENYAFTYYPGVSNLDQALAIDIRAGSEVAIDFAVARTQLYTVRGRLTDAATNRPPSTVNIAIAYQTVMGQSGMSMVGPLYDSASGNFEVRSLLPGSYLLQITSVSGSARLPVEVVNRDLEVSAVIRNGVSVAGIVRVEGGTLPSALQRIQLRPIIDGVVSLIGTTPSAPAAADGTFKLNNVPPGEYQISIPSMPDYFVKEIRFDRNDALSRPLVVPDAGTEASSLEIVLSPNVGQIDGIITDERTQPVSGIQAVLVPDKNRDRTELFKAITSDQAGHFVMKGVAPGDYKLFAWDVLDNFGYFDPDLVKRSETRGKAVHIEESSKLTVEAKIITSGQ